MCDCVYCITPIMGAIALMGGEPIHPECKEKLNEEIHENDK